MVPFDDGTIVVRLAYAVHASGASRWPHKRPHARLCGDDRRQIL